MRSVEFRLPLPFDLILLFGKLHNFAVDRRSAVIVRADIERLSVIFTQPHEPISDLVQFPRRVVGIEPRAGRRLVDKVDRLIGKIAVGNIAGGKFDCRVDRLFGNDDGMVCLVLIFEPS